MKHRNLNTARCARTGVALAAAALFAGQAWALGLGRLAVQSSLGETLRAEIDVTNLSAEEASTLQARIAGPDAYRTAGVDYNAVLPGTRVSVQRRPDGRAVLRVTSDRAVVEPFLDVIVELSWSSGRLLRSYTLLLDPPATRVAPPAMAAAPTAPVIAPPPPRPAPAPAPAVAAAPRLAPPPAPMVPATAAAAAESVRVVPGDTLGRIAERVRPSGVSLDQMLVALFRANPDAFMGENMNRLKAGAVLDVPAADRASQLDEREARRVIVAQSADFNSFRQRLAGAVGAAEATAAPSSRQATGSVEATVDDRKAAAAPTPDKLTLAQGSVQASAATAGISSETASKDAAARVEELASNVAALKQLQSDAAASMPAGTAVAAAGTAPAPAAAPTAAAPTVVASPPPAPTPPAPKPAPAATPKLAEEEPGLLATLMGNPLVLPLAGVLVALLAGLGLYRLRSRNRTPVGETSFLESRLQPDSFFGASGGQRIDTRESTSTTTSSSSMNYSLSQLDAIGDVDPVAEADVYLAYGRDLQAEEILKEALRSTPDRQAIRLKLLEVYAKRRDAKAFELLATQLFALTGGQGDDWAKAQELGRSLDDGNPLYRPGGQPEGVTTQGGALVEPLSASTMPQSQRADPSTLPPDVATLPSGLDLDLDVDPDATRVAPVAAAAPSEATATLPVAPMTTAAADELSFELPPAADPGALDFELPGADEPTLPAPTPSAETMPRMSVDLDFETPPPIPSAEVSDVGGGFPEFELSKSPDDVPSTSEYGSLNDDPLTRKLELAEEFRQIGDLEGARDLLEEVVSKADGTLKSKAEGMLARLS